MNFLFLCSLATALMGILLLLLKSNRPKSQALALVSFHAACWFASAAAVSQIPYSAPILLRLNAAITSFFPFSLFILIDSLSNSANTWIKPSKKVLFFLIFSVLLSLLCTAPDFVSYSQTHSYQIRGESYIAHSLLVVTLLVATVAYALVKIRKSTGVARLELQLFALNLGAGAAIGSLFIIAANVLQIPELKVVGVASIAISYTLIAIILSLRPVFGAGELLEFFSTAIPVLFLLTILSYRMYFAKTEPSHEDTFLTLCTILVGLLLYRSHNKDKSSASRKLREARMNLIAESLNGKSDSSLRPRLESNLCRIFESPRCYLLDNVSSKEDRKHSIILGRGLKNELVDSGWSTPESIERQRATPARQALRDFMTAHQLGALICAPRGSPAPSLIIALGTREDHWPFTYPEIERLQNLAELVDHLLTRAQLAEQEAMRAKMEYLAMMSRGVAHDLKNLITPISSFLVYTEDRATPGSAEADVHASAKRSVTMMNAYVSEALFFAQRLEPSLAPTAPDLLLRLVVQTAGDRAAQRGVVLERENLTLEPITADGVLLQRLLSNLVANAIDASPPGETVRIMCRPARPGWVSFEVADQGPGIPPENLNRVFDPYFTTKQFGSDIRGFGLGLTICQKIAQLHGGTVSFATDRAVGALAIFEMPVSPTPAVA